MRYCPATILIPHAEQQLGTVAGVRDWPGQSAHSSPMRISDGGESNPPLPRLWSTAAFGRRALYSRRNRQAARAEVSGGGSLCSKPETILSWYRRLIAPKFDGSKHRSYPGRPRVAPRHGGSRRPNGPGEQRLGLRSHRWRSRQSRPSTL